MGISFSNFSGGSSAASSGFNLDIGSSGNTTFELSEAQPAGGYSITSQQSDASIDFYAIASDGSLSGYTNNKALTATRPFSKLVVYGATNNDLITFEYKETAPASTSGSENSGAAPYVSNVSVTSLPLLDDTTVVTGGNFATDVTVTFTGTDSVVRNAKSVVRTNSTQLIVTRPDDAIEDYAPYTMSVINPGIPNPTTVSFTETVTMGSDPVWSTPAGSLPDALSGSAYSTAIAASDPDGELITYSIVSGQLPGGLSLNSSTGEISGTGSQEVNETFTVRASDPEGNYSEREFSLFVGVPRIDVEYVVVAGGGGGGAIIAGGGAGGYRQGTLTQVAASDVLFLKVGAGGASSAGYPSRGGEGSDSSFGPISASGGGAGAGEGPQQFGAHPGMNGSPGGSGGGGSQYSGVGGAGNVGGYNPVEGYAGGGVSGYLQAYAGGAGGGAAGVGGVGTGASGGNGGPGRQNPITGTYLAGGGAGGARVGVQYPPGSPGIGGGGGENSPGEANTGGGGGGRQAETATGLTSGGGSGVIILKYPDTHTAYFSGSVSYTTNPPSGGYKITTVTAASTDVETVVFSPT